MKTASDDFISRIIEDKRREVEKARQLINDAEIKRLAMSAEGAERGFRAALSSPGPMGVNIIAEIKRASPSKGVIRENLDVISLSQSYQDGGAAAISVLTEQNYFKGSNADLQAVRKSVNLPVLRKDFIVTEYQIYESRYIGADAILLIVRALSDRELRDFNSLAGSLGLDVLTEVHNREEMQRAITAGAAIIGINNRNLSTFVTDINVSIELAAELPEGTVAVAESGIKNRADIKNITAAGIHNFLTGESIVRSDDPAGHIRSLCCD